MKKPQVSRTKPRVQYTEKDLPKALKTFGLKSISVKSSERDANLNKRKRSNKRNSNLLWELSPDKQTTAVTELSSTYYSTHSNMRSSGGSYKKASYSEKRVTPSSSLLSKKLKCNVDNYFKSKIPLSQLIEEIKQKVFNPIRTQINYNNKRTRNINHAVEHMKTHVSSISEDLAQSVINNRTFMKESAMLSCEIEEMNIENNDIDKEINEIRRENAELLQEKLMIERETAFETNDYFSLKNEVNLMRQNSVLLSKISEDIQYEKKVLSSALLLITKKIFKLKEMINTYQKNHSNITEELLMLIN